VKNPFKMFSAARSATAEALDVLDQVREGLAAKRAEIARIDTAPAPVAEVMKGLGEWADRVATDAIDALRVERLLAPGRAGQGLDLPNVPATNRDASVVFGLLLAANRQAFLDLIQGQVEDLTFGVETMDEPSRAKALARAQGELAEAELLEERLVRDLEAVGVQVSRRPDASPAAVLASDRTLAKLAG